MADKTLSFSPARTRAEARAMGLKKYFTGKPCRHGHIAERYVLSPGCIECVRVEHRRLDRREYHKIYQTAYLADPANRARRQEHDRRNKKKPEAKRQRRQNREAKRVALAGRPKPKTCEICAQAGRISFDHCHTTGRFRGWICSRCNLIIGRAGDSPALLRALAEYVERNTHAQIDFVALLETQRVLERT